MDPMDAVQRLLAAMGRPDAAALVDAAAAEFVEQAPPDEVLDVVMKRNLVFVSWRRGDATGTWVLGFDRDGVLTSATTL